MHYLLNIPIILITLITAWIAFSWAKKEKNKENFFLFGYLYLIFILTYSVGILGYKISGTYISIENTIAEIEESKKEIKKVANTLVKISYIFADGCGRHDGMPPEHLKQIIQYQDEIEMYLTPELDKEIQETIDELNEKINNRNSK